MAQETLQQVFGANVSQTATELIITKADLESTGFVPSATNNPGELFVALLLFAANTYNTTNQGNNPQIPITITQSAYPSVDVRNSTNYLQQSFTVALETLLSAGSILPANYI